MGQWGRASSLDSFRLEFRRVWSMCPRAILLCAQSSVLEEGSGQRPGCESGECGRNPGIDLDLSSALSVDSVLACHGHPAIPAR